MAEALPCHLLTLSPEILTLIANAIYEQHTLRNFANTCRVVHQIADPLLYRNVTIRSISSCDAFSQVVLRYPNRAWDVQSLNIHILCYSEDPEDMDGMFIRFLRKLRDLNIRFPGLPDGIQEDMGHAQRFASLHSLKTCTLDLTQTDCGMWPLSTAKLLFLHPTLQCLTVHFACLERDTYLFSQVPSASTSLQELSLLSCNITADSLSGILRMPRCLKKFSLGIPFSYNSYEFGNSSSNYIAEMYPVYETLECFRVIAAPPIQTKWARGPAFGLQNFTALKYLEIGGESLVQPNEIYLTRVQPALLAADYRLMMPPKLEVLKVSPKAWTHHLHKVVAEKCEVPSLRRVIMSMVAEEDVSELRSCCQKSEVELQVIYESAHVSFYGPPVWEIPEQIR